MRELLYNIFGWVLAVALMLAASVLYGHASDGGSLLAWIGIVVCVLLAREVPGIIWRMTVEWPVAGCLVSTDQKRSLTESQRVGGINHEGHNAL